VFTPFHKPPYTYPYGRSVDETTTLPEAQRTTPGRKKSALVAARMRRALGGEAGIVSDPPKGRATRGCDQYSHYRKSGLLQQFLLLQPHFVAIKRNIATISTLVVIGQTYCHGLVLS
jgi:hypothetical protein